jgi:hypothetical protein
LWPASIDALKEFDRQMGALFGAAKVLCVAITFFAVTLSAQARTAVLNSRSGYYIAVLLDRADGVMPRELHEVLDPYLKKLEQELDPTKKPAEGETQPSSSQAQQGSAAAPEFGLRRLPPTGNEWRQRAERDLDAGIESYTESEYNVSGRF